MNQELVSWPYNFCPECGKLSPRARERGTTPSCWVCGLQTDKKTMGRTVYLDQEEAAFRNLDYPSES